MSFPRSPRLLKGGVVLVDATSGAIQRIVALQYNPDSITRTLAIQAHGDGGVELGLQLDALGLSLIHI